MPSLSLADIRTDYKKASLKKSDVASNPIMQFNKWFEEVIHSQAEEPNAMTLATTDKNLQPSARIVLLKGIDEKYFYFYTNYNSQKGRELIENPKAALVLFWKELERQVRIQGTVTKTSAEQSDAYYFSRPEGSQLGAWASPQSSRIANREELEEKVAVTTRRFQQEPLKRPPFWGGFRLEPTRIEFWQGRPSRLHDRILYLMNEQGEWDITRLAP